MNTVFKSFSCGGSQNLLQIIVAALLLSGVGSVMSAAAQDPLPSPTMLRRLAEAVDGHRTGQPVWVVVDLVFPNEVFGVVGSMAEAQTIANRFAGDSLGRIVRVAGPYAAPRMTLPRDLVPPFGPIIDTIPAVIFFPPCVHDGWVSVMGDRAICPFEWHRREIVLETTIAMRLASGEVLTRVLPASADAVFFTLPAIDKFVVPYYARILGIDAVAQLRRQLLQGILNPGQ